MTGASQGKLGRLHFHRFWASRSSRVCRAFALLLVGVVLAACSRKAPGAAESTGTDRTALSEAATRTYGFESLADWSAIWSSPSLTLSNVHVEGSKSVSVGGGGWSSFVGRKLSNEGNGPTVVGFHLRIPATQPNPSWFGTVQLFVDIPSRGINNQPLGLKDLKEWTPGDWKRAEFVVPASVRAALGKTYSDLRWRIELNRPSNATAGYLFDRFTLGPLPPACTPTSDGNPCTTDTCDANGQQQHTPVPAGTSCSNGNACDGAETCNVSGTCTSGPPVVCVALDQCHLAGTCEPGSGVCSNPPKPDGVPCTDGDACTQTDTCQAGICAGSNPVVCAAPDQCHLTGQCDPANGQCTNPAKPDGTECTDGNLCTQSDSCQTGVCIGADPVVCVAQNNCEEPGTCDPATGECSPGVPIPTCGLPPDPATIAPALDPTITTTLFDAVSFLFESATPVQTDVSAGAIDPLRASLLRGSVRLRDGSPLSGVTVEVLGSPDTGRTLTRLDGRFDLVVNGGGSVVLKYSHPAYLPVQRQLEVDWSDYSTAPEVVMMGYDETVSVVDLTQSDVATATGSVVTDEDGARQATVMFMPGTTATITHADGTQEQLLELSLRLTEYTVGEDGEAAMPGTLPPASAYTYAVEISSDEVVARGIKRNGIDTVLSQPVSYYLTNFLGFEAGTPVPVGYYDGDKGQWIADESGVVMNILSTSADIATVDTDGDGAPDPAARLEELGLSAAELIELARRFGPGDSLWRMRLIHFSSFDFNMGWGLPSDADYWDENPQPNLPNPKDCRNKDWDQAKGSILECSEQILGETVSIVGTPFTLNYRSDRVPGRRASRVLTVPLTPASSFPSLNRTEVQVTIAGQVFETTVDGNATKNTFTFEWDGRDAYGRTVLGRQNAVVRVGYSFSAARYAAPARFGSGAGEGGSVISLVPTRRSAVLWRTKAIVGVENWDARSMGIGGWNIDVHHHYDRVGRDIRQGDGSVRTVALAPWQTKLLGTSPGTTTSELTCGPDGSLYGSSHHALAVWRRKPNGELSIVAGGGNPPDGLGDGGPATQALVFQPWSFAVAPDGGMYIAENRSRIRYVSPDGIISTFAGNGEAEDWYNRNGDTFCDVNGPIHRTDPTATVSPTALAIAPDGTLYMAGGYCGLRKITPDGMLTTITPAEWPRDWWNGRVLRPFANLATTKDGSVIAGFPEGCIASISPTRGYRLVAGDPLRCAAPRPPTPSPAPDGAPVWAVPDSIATDRNGDIYLTEGRLVRRISDGVLTTIAQLPESFHQPHIAVTPDGKIFVSESQIAQIEPALPGLSLDDAAVASEDGSQLFVFNRQGRHLRTVDTLLGFDVHKFGYNTAGRLASVQDAYGATTTLEYDGSGNPVSIISPFGQVTALAVSGHGFLSQITSPEGNAWTFDYDAGGLMLSSHDPRNGEHIFGYDTLGYLTSDRDPAFATQTLGRTVFLDEALQKPRVLKRGHEATRTSAEGASFGYREELLPTDEVKQTSSHPDGTKSIFSRRVTGVIAMSSPDGSTGSGTEGPDPRFGTQAPLLATSATTTPLGLQRITTQSRSATLTNPADPLSLSTLVDQNSVNGRTQTTTFTAQGRRVEMITRAGRRRTAYLDTRGNTVRIDIPGLVSTMYGYDTLGHLISSEAGTGADRRATASAYEDGWLETITDPEGRTASFQRDLDGRVLFQTLSGGRVVGFRYDEVGNVTGVTPPGKPEHSFGYNAVNRMSSYDPPPIASILDGSTTYSYDLDRNITIVRRPDTLEIGYQYDAAGRLEYVDLPGVGEAPAEAVSLSYAVTTGQLATLTHSSGVGIAYTYDGFLVASEMVSGLGIAPVVLSRGYDPDFRLTRESINGTLTVAFGYDADSLLTSAGALTLSRSEQNGLLIGSSLGNVSDAWAYNGFAEPTAYSVRMSGAEIFATTFVRDKLGRVEQKTEAINGTTSVFDYHYDGAGRLERVEKDGTPVSAYEYDLNGNRTSALSFAEPSSIIATYDDQDRLLTYGDAIFSYTDNGELRTKIESGEMTTFSYDALGALRSVELPDGRLVEYLVDGRGRRVGRMIDGARVQSLLYATQLAPVAELDGMGNMVARFVYGTKINVPEYMVKDGVTYRIVTDHLGSPRLVVDAVTGAIAQRMEYDEWGNVLADTAPGFQPFGFAGGLYDRDTHLLHFGARDYDAVVGRWVAKDPVLFSVNENNLLTYALNDPVNRLDPLGLYSVEDLLYDASDISAGFGDTLTSGFGLLDTSITERARRALGVDDVINRCSGFYSVGKVGAYAWAAATSGASGARLAGWQTRVGVHGAHHSFGPLGKLAHLQLNYWRIGTSGSGGAWRIPLPWH
jgi:RHS repeat-associated protein